MDCTPPGSWEPLFLWMNGGATVSPLPVETAHTLLRCTLAEAISQMGNYENALPVFITTISFLVANVISNTTSS